MTQLTQLRLKSSVTPTLLLIAATHLANFLQVASIALQTWTK